MWHVGFAWGLEGGQLGLKSVPRHTSTALGNGVLVILLSTRSRASDLSKNWEATPRTPDLRAILQMLPTSGM
ncbi:hypothetical protein P3T76_005317 [Phytophthora citrophthora]|uniref:Uncharacterized protein n=1 Tax=Phytophthora citrophthora TaxID=4793 RepID=A0AAD9GTL5_9STRA|nr:hypothetical protein P3T76_005317 [Phytophthora citrophthora]